MNLQLSIPAILLATIVGMVIAMVWYDKRTIGPAWTRQTGIEKGTRVAFLILIASIFLTAVGLDIFMVMAKGLMPAYDSLMVAVAVGFVAWIGFSVSTLAQHNAFEKKPVKLTVINLSYQLVLFEAMALAIGFVS